MKKKWIYVPVEVKAREFRGKLLLSCFLAENKFGVLIGERSKINRRLMWFPPGVYLEKGIGFTGRDRFVLNKRLGNHILTCEEEGLNIPSKTYTNNFGEKCLDLSDKYLAWGKNEAAVIEEITGKAWQKVVLTGNARMDLLRPELRDIFVDEDVVQNHAPYVLINCNFGFYTCTNDPDGHVQQHIETYWNKDKWCNQEGKREYAAYYTGLIEFMRNMFDKFVRMASEVSRNFPDYNVIVRPHPSARMQKYKNELAGIDNVHVTKKGDANKWIRNAKAVIHNNCTTGVEAFLMEKSVISYRPFESETYDNYLPNALSQEVYSEEELLGLLDSILRDGQSLETNDNRWEIAKWYIANVDGKMASERITEQVKALDVEKKELNLGLINYARNSFVFPKKTARVIKRMLTGRSERSKRKFPGVSEEEIMKNIHSFGRLLDRFHGLEAKKIYEDVFLISN